MCVFLARDTRGGGSSYCHVCVMAQLHCSFPQFSTADLCKIIRVFAFKNCDWHRWVFTLPVWDFQDSVSSTVSTSTKPTVAPSSPSTSRLKLEVKQLWFSTAPAKWNVISGVRGTTGLFLQSDNWSALSLRLPFPGSLVPADALKCKRSRKAQCDAWTEMFDRRCQNSQWVCGRCWTVLIILKRLSSLHFLR